MEIRKLIAIPNKAKVSPNTFKTVSWENQMFLRINPTNSGIFASLARTLTGLMSFSCGCLYLSKDGHLYFSSNGFPKSNDNLARDKRNRICDSRTKEFLNKLSELVSKKEQLREEDFEDLINIFFQTLLKTMSHSRPLETRFQLACIQKEKGRDQALASLASLLKNKFFNPHYQWNLDEFYETLKAIDKYNSSARATNKDDFARIISNFSPFFFLFFGDLNNFLTLIKFSKEDDFLEGTEGGNETENYKVLINIFQDAEESSWERSILPAQLIKNRKGDIDSVQSRQDIGEGSFHAEMRVFESVFFTASSDPKQRRKLYCKENWNTFIEAVQEERLVISKPCCFYCHTFLIALSLLFEDDKFYNQLKKEVSAQESPLDHLTFEHLRIREKTAYQKGFKIELPVSTQITSFIGSSCKLYSWISPSFFMIDKEDRDFAKCVNIIFKAIKNQFNKETIGLNSVKGFTSETSEALSHQIKAKVGVGLAPLRWDENQHNTENLNEYIMEELKEMMEGGNRFLHP